MDLYNKIKDKTYIIAEMSGNHNGDRAKAFEIIKAAKEAGADCIKIQTYTPDTLTIDCDNEYFHIGSGTWEGENLYSLYGKAYTPWEWQKDLQTEANRLGIDFLSTPFDNTSVDFLEDMGMEFYKIASFELVDIPLVKYIAQKGKPIILSTGMSNEQEIAEALSAIKEQGKNNQVVLLKCSSSYPAISDDMNLATIKDMADRFNVPIGLSDHTLGDLSAIAAVAMGAKVVEKHFCMDRSEGGPDSSFSMEPQEFKKMVDNIRQIEKAIGSVSYGVTKTEEDSMVFRRSLFVVKDVKAGEVFTDENVRSIRPGYGIKPRYYEDVLGKTATCDISRGTPLKMEMVNNLREK